MVMPERMSMLGTAWPGQARAPANSSAFGVGERANFGAATSREFENHFARRRMIYATADERVLASAKLSAKS